MSELYFKAKYFSSYSHLKMGGFFGTAYRQNNRLYLSFMLYTDETENHDLFSDRLSSEIVSIVKIGCREYVQKVKSLAQNFLRQMPLLEFYLFLHSLQLLQSFVYLSDILAKTWNSVFGDSSDTVICLYFVF